jgi:rare lipoprotein A
MAHTRAFVRAVVLLSIVLFCTFALAQAPKSEPTAPAAPAAAPPAPAPAQAPAAAAAAKDKDTGLAAYYSNKFHGRPTASKEIYNKDALTAANNQHPFGTRLKVTNLKNNKSVVVRINDRMRTSSPCIIDVSYQTAKQLGFLKAGTTEVKLEVVEGGKKKK